MCTTVDAEFILASMLSSRETVTFSDLQDYTDKVYSHLRGQNVFLDISCHSVYAAIQGSPDAFQCNEEDAFCKSDNPGRFFEEAFILDHLGRFLDRDTRRGIYDLARQ
jgi:hypothetical protein